MTKVKLKIAYLPRKRDYATQSQIQHGGFYSGPKSSSRQPYEHDTLIISCRKRGRGTGALADDELAPGWRESRRHYLGAVVVSWASATR